MTSHRTSVITGKIIKMTVVNNHSLSSQDEKMIFDKIIEEYDRRLIEILFGTSHG